MATSLTQLTRNCRARETSCEQQSERIHSAVEVLSFSCRRTHLIAALVYAVSTPASALRPGTAAAFVMSRGKKQVDQDYCRGEIAPPTASQQIAKSLGTRGGNIVEVLFENGTSTLCIIPSKFNKKVWIRTGGLVIVEETVSEDTTAKVTATVVSVLHDDHIKALRKQGVPIPSFGVDEGAEGAQGATAGPSAQGPAPDPEERSAEDPASDDDSLPDIQPNMNHRLVQEYSDEEDSSDG